GEPGPSGPDDAWSPPGWTGPVPGGSVSDATPPPDPAVRRLLPDASDDVEVAAEFRRFTPDDLAARKVGRLVLLARMLADAEAAEVARFAVVREEAEEVAGALTDVCLVLAERLGLRTDEQVEGLYDELDREGDDGPDDGEVGGAPRRFLVSVFLLTGLL